jgi:uncharacterized protein (DUF58 family)
VTSRSPHYACRVQVHPTRTSVDLALAGLLCMALGFALREGAVVGWGGALLVGLAVARAATRVDVAGIRAAGFEMTWRGEARAARATRGETLELEAEVRNRDIRAARFTSLRVVCSSELEVTLRPEQGEVPGGGRLLVRVSVRAPRVGRHAIHGLSLELQGAPGLFEVPLTFSNPYGIEVLPGPLHGLLRSARGGRSRSLSERGRPGPLAGEGDSLRELREHQPGDPFRRIAWKASARRGRLMVREYEQEEHDVVFVLLDASVEHWSGRPGEAALDHAIDEAAAVAVKHLGRGDAVGLGIIGARPLAWLDAARGPAQALRVALALSHATGCIERDRSALDESDVAARVLEHLRPLDPEAARGVKSHELDRIARRADRVIAARAPFRDVTAEFGTKRERVLRAYLEAFGIGSPARLEPDRQHSDLELAKALSKLSRERVRPSIVYLWSPAPDPSTRPALERALLQPKRRFELRFLSMPLDRGIPETPAGVPRVVGETVALRARAALRRGEMSLRRMGIRVDALRSRVKPENAA